MQPCSVLLVPTGFGAVSLTCYDYICIIYNGKVMSASISSATTISSFLMRTTNILEVAFDLLCIRWI